MSDTERTWLTNLVATWRADAKSAQVSAARADSIATEAVDRACAIVYTSSANQLEQVLAGLRIMEAL